MIRTPTPTDAAELVPLFAALSHPASADQISNRLQRLNADPEYQAWVVDGDRPVLAFAAGHLLFGIEDDRPAAQLIALVTAPDARGRGLGSELCAAFEAWAVEQGAARATLGSGTRRGQAHEFYLRRGYAPTGVRFGKNLA